MENWTRKFTRQQKAGFREGVVQNPQLRTLCSYISILMCRSRKGDEVGCQTPLEESTKLPSPLSG